MTWNQEHSRSEKFAIDALDAQSSGDTLRAQELFCKAGAAEASALNYLPIDKQRTRGITAVSAVALWYKGRDYAKAELLDHKYLA